MDLNDNIIKDVANFMGHAENIHNKIYRLPVETRDIVRMSNVLEMVQGDAASDSSDDEADDVEMAHPPSSTRSKVRPRVIRSPSQELFSSTSEQPSVSNSPCHPAVRPRPHNSSNIDADVNEISDPLEMGVSHNKRRSGVRFCGPKRSWSAEEKAAILKECHTYLETDTLPSYQDAQDVAFKNPALSNRSPTSIRLWIENQIKKRKSSKLFTNNHNKKVIKRIRWTIEEKDTLDSLFAHHIQGNTLPSQQEIQSVIDENPHLRGRSVKCIKTAVLNARNRYRAKW